MWCIPKTRWWESLKLRIQAMTSPSAQTVLDMDSKLKSFSEDLETRRKEIEQSIEDVNKHLGHFRRVQDQNNASIDKIMHQFEQDIPAFQDQCLGSAESLTFRMV